MSHLDELSGMSLVNRFTALDKIGVRCRPSNHGYESEIAASKQYSSLSGLEDNHCRDIISTAIGNILQEYSISMADFRDMSMNEYAKELKEELSDDASEGGWRMLNGRNILEGLCHQYLSLIHI